MQKIENIYFEIFTWSKEWALNKDVWIELMCGKRLTLAWQWRRIIIDDDDKDDDELHDV